MQCMSGWVLVGMAWAAFCSWADIWGCGWGVGVMVQAMNHEFEPL